MTLSFDLLGPGENRGWKKGSTLALRNPFYPCLSLLSLFSLNFFSALLYFCWLLFAFLTSLLARNLCCCWQGTGEEEEEERRIRPGSIHHGKTEGWGGGVSEFLHRWLKTTDWSRETEQTGDRVWQFDMRFASDQLRLSGDFQKIQRWLFLEVVCIFLVCLVGTYSTIPLSTFALLNFHRQFEPRLNSGVPEQDTEPWFQWLDKCCPFTIALQLYSCIISSNQYGFTSDSCIASISVSVSVGSDG